MGFMCFGKILLLRMYQLTSVALADVLFVVFSWVRIAKGFIFS